MTKPSLSQEYIMQKTIIYCMPIKFEFFKCIISCELDIMSFVLQIRQLRLRDHTFVRCQIWDLNPCLTLRLNHVRVPLQCYLPPPLHSTSAQILKALYLESISFLYCYSLCHHFRPDPHYDSHWWFQCWVHPSTAALPFTSPSFLYLTSLSCSASPGASHFLLRWDHRHSWHPRTSVLQCH